MKHFRKGIHYKHLIKELLKERGWSANELARRSHISSSTVAELIRYRTFITKERAEKLAAAFGVSTDCLFKVDTHVGEVRCYHLSNEEICNLKDFWGRRIFKD